LNYTRRGCLSPKRTAKLAIFLEDQKEKRSIFLQKQNA